MTEPIVTAWVLGLISGWLTLWIDGKGVPQWFKTFTWISTGVFIFSFVFMGL